MAEAESAKRAPTGALSDRVRSLRLPPPAAPSRGRWVPWVLLLLVLIGFGYTAVGGVIPYVPRWLAEEDLVDDALPVLPATTTPNEPISPTSLSPGLPAVAGASGATPKIVLESKGYVIPEQQILVSPQVGGRVVELNFEAGQQVTKGEVLAVLDSTEYRAEYQRSLADVEAARERMIETKEGSRPDELRQARAELAETTAQYDQAKRTYERRKELFEQKIVTLGDLEDAESQFTALARRMDRQQATLQLMIDGPRVEKKRAAEADVRRAEADLSRAKWRLDNTTIIAPITGTILKKNAELGNLVNPGAFNGSFSLCDLADLAKLEVELSIQERDIAKVFQYQKCRVRPEAFPDRFYEGYVSRLMPIADRAKGAVPVRVRLTVPEEEQGVYLKPEMGATVTFFAEKIAEKRE